MEDNKIVNKLNVWKHRTLYSLGSAIVFAIAIGFSIGIGSVYPSVFLYDISVVFSITTGVSFGTFVFSAIKQSKYQGLADKNIERDTSNENNQIPKSNEDCQISMSNTQHVDSVRQIEEPTNPSNNRVLQLIRKKVK